MRISQSLSVFVAISMSLGFDIRGGSLFVSSIFLVRRQGLDWEARRRQSCNVSLPVSSNQLLRCALSLSLFLCQIFLLCPSLSLSFSVLRFFSLLFSLLIILHLFFLKSSVSYLSILFLVFLSWFLFFLVLSCFCLSTIFLKDVFLIKEQK